MNVIMLLYRTLQCWSYQFYKNYYYYYYQYGTDENRGRFLNLDF